MRIDRYEKERVRPRRVTLRSEALTKETVERTFRLKGDDTFKRRVNQEEP